MPKLRDFLEHPDEILPAVRMYLEVRRATRLPADPGLAFCYDILNSVSRSFAVVIQKLPTPLRDAVCVFYLVLRGLDTVEDDMAIPMAEKLPCLRSFHEKIYERGSRWPTYGKDHYNRLMAQFGAVVDVFLRLDPTFRAVIADVAKKMGHGMAEYIELEVETVKDLDLYCHYVAGLVGEGLSALFAASGLEDPKFKDLTDMSNEMGLFLQKTNIIRDYLEDINEEPAPRMFWPREVWGKEVEGLEEFKELKNRGAALDCLNALITDALRHVPTCFAYMKMLQNQQVFRFCAIPQVMAIGTLALCFNNGGVFEGEVKMRRGQTCVIFESVESMKDVYKYFREFAGTIGAKCQASVLKRDPNSRKTMETIEKIEELCEKGLKECGVPTNGAPADVSDQPVEWWVRLGIMCLSIGYFLYAWGIAGFRASLGVAPNPSNFLLDMMQRLCSLLLLFVGVIWVGVLGKRLGTPEP
ncbi:unnamed protein product [Ostreobium quekettii]|uniref:Squalene synthase n=1 Tax=Ostreobium quekettii TaxID=121088 RepID=A0A8S1ISE6_9CHLO|nr:unnamed protein product [Ostreobium quekettii]|eukprot:evm.model.scf_1991.1 EVM.evm.TU.scf_1991.1   scf_1991:3051-7817(+)